MIDLLGKQVRIITSIYVQIGNINFSNLSKGVYLVEINTAKQCRFVKKTGYRLIL
jgi:hypothetical protein